MPFSPSSWTILTADAAAALATLRPRYDQELRIYDEDLTDSWVIPNNMILEDPRPEGNLERGVSWRMTTRFLAHADFNSQILRNRRIRLWHYMGTPDAASLQRFPAFDGWITAAEKSTDAAFGDVWSLVCDGRLVRATWPGPTRIQYFPTSTNLGTSTGAQMNWYRQARQFSMVAAGPSNSQVIPEPHMYDPDVEVTIDDYAKTTHYTLSNASGWTTIAWTASGPAAGTKIIVRCKVARGGFAVTGTPAAWTDLAVGEELIDRTEPRYSYFFAHQSNSGAASDWTDVVEVSTASDMSAKVQPGTIKVVHELGLVLPDGPRTYLPADAFYLRGRVTATVGGGRDAAGLIESVITLSTDLNAADLSLEDTAVIYRPRVADLRNRAPWDVANDLLDGQIPANWKVHDTEDGKVKAYLYTQASTPHWELAGMVEVMPADTPETFTGVVVTGRRQLVNRAAEWSHALIGAAGTGRVDNAERILDLKFDTKATIPSGSAPFRFVWRIPLRKDITLWPFIRSIKLWHQGRVRVGISAVAFPEDRDAFWIQIPPEQASKEAATSLSSGSPTVDFSDEQQLKYCFDSGVGPHYIQIWGYDWTDNAGTSHPFGLFEVEIWEEDTAVWRCELTDNGTGSGTTIKKATDVSASPAPTTTVFAVDSVTDIDVDDEIAVDRAGTVYRGVIKSKSGSTLTLYSALGATPVAGDDVTTWRRFGLTATGNFSVGDSVPVTIDGNTYVGRIGSIDGSGVVALLDPLERSPAIGATIPAPSSGSGTGLGSGYTRFALGRRSFRYCGQARLKRDMSSYSDGIHKKRIVDMDGLPAEDCASVAEKWLDEDIRVPTRARIRCLYNPGIELGSTVRVKLPDGTILVRFVMGMRKGSPRNPMMDLDVVDYAA